ncbi:unnamed protein product [Lupinus luteus]|uniref:Uncharacterized protein n=1 Tax=Lupinus luteus TaxID=3873 RepID=A0AAV1X970_LUPLU
MAIQQERALGMTSLEIVLRQSQKDHRIMLQNQHTEKASGKELLNTKKNPTNVNGGFDPNQSSERRVRKGNNKGDGRYPDADDYFKSAINGCIVQTLLAITKRRRFLS